MARQVSVFLQNQPGHLEKVTEVLQRKLINIRAMTLSGSAYGWGILNLLLNDPDEGHKALVEAGYSAVLRPIIVVRMPDRPGGLHDLLSYLSKGEINIKNAYATLVPKEGAAILEQMTGRKAEVMPDPVCLLSADEWAEDGAI